MRKMALDVGDRRIGIAISDLLGIIANPYETYTRVSEQQDMRYFADLASKMQCDTIVIGLPINMDGTSGKRVELVEQFGAKLKEFTSVKIVYQDERLSTVEAERALLESDMRRDKRKQVIDKVAAAIILSSYLNYHQ